MRWLLRLAHASESLDQLLKSHFSGPVPEALMVSGVGSGHLVYSGSPPMNLV